MTTWQLTICAIALFANGHDKSQVSKALNVDTKRGQELIEDGASAQRNGRMGQMKQHRLPGDPLSPYGASTKGLTAPLNKSRLLAREQLETAHRQIQGFSESMQLNTGEPFAVFEA